LNVSKRSFGIVASILAATLAVGAAAIVRAHTVAPSKGSTDNASTAQASTGVPAPTTNANALGRLLAVSPDGAGAGLPMYSAAGTVSSSSVSSWIKSKYPKQAGATQTSDPATRYWALLIGLNDYAGSTADNVGSRQDAESLQTVLLRLGWRSDHIILIKDRDGTASHIIDGIRWLASKTNSSSTAVFHYAGHENWTRTTSDGDNESRDVEIWAADNRMIIDGTLGKEFNRITAGHMWIDFATCRAAGFSDPGMIKSGRVLTYSSPENEYSYEDPRLHHSVFGWFMINQSLYGGKGNTNHDKTITVEEAFNYARPNVYSYTHGAQRPVMIDKTNGAFSLRVPPKPAPSSSSGGTTPTPSSTAPKTCVFLCF
jgi:hypothetical protein